MRFDKRFAYIAALIMIIAVSAPAHAAQSTTYTWGENSRGWFVHTQDAYLPDRNVTWLGLTGPEDMAFDGNDVLYIADTGGRRILKYDIHSDTVAGEIRDGEFNTPRGVFLSEDGLLYVADAAAEAVFVFNEAGERVRKVVRPTEISFADTPFNPYRVAADKSGNLYIISEGTYAGIIQMSPQNEFLGFFASNRSTRSFVQLLQDIFFTDRQKEALQPRQPTTFSNVYVDGRGIVYSTSMGEAETFAGNAIKKHNMAGRNTLPEMWSTFGVTDITVDGGGIIYSTDINGYIQVNANDGREIFFFGAGQFTEEDIAGMFSSLSSVAVASDGTIWALDNKKAFLQSFTPTEYALQIYKALALFNEGQYAESGEVWNDVLRYNQMSVLAHNGLGMTYLYRQDYAKAAEEFLIAGNRTDYSDAFWETRNQWLLNNLAVGLIILAAVILALNAVRYADRQKRIKTAVAGVKGRLRGNKWAMQALFPFSVMRHPLDSCYYLKRREKGSLGGAVCMYALFFVSYMVYQTSKAFILQTVAIEDMDFNIIIGGFFGITALFVISNYLVTSINDGEGGFRDIFKLFSYASFPLSVTMLAVTALSYMITLNEVFLVDFALVFGGAWSLILLYLGLQEVHGYNVWNTLKSIIISVFFMLIALVVMFNLLILFNQFTQFIEAFVREVLANAFDFY